MSKSPVSTNGHGTNGHGTTATKPRAAAVISPERRQTLPPETVSPEALIERHVEGARRQLAEARERLKAARRRVVQLEDALCNWERFAAELRQDRGAGPR